MNSARAFSALAITALLAACGSMVERPHPAELTPGDPSAPSQVTPSEALAIANRLASHPWRPFSKNILHGKDRTGVLVNTPDAGFREPPERPGWGLPGEVNTGVPY